MIFSEWLWDYLTVTLERVEVHDTALSCAETAMPTTTFAVMERVCDPTLVQVVPSSEIEPVKRVPTRATRSHLGGAPASLEVPVVAPAVILLWKATPLVGETAMN